MIELMHILLPGLFSYDLELSTQPPKEFPNLSKLFSKATVIPDKPACLENALKHWFSGLSGGELPTGALGALSQGLIDLKDQAIWIRADPVVFQADAHQVFCLGNELLDLSKDESDQLAHDLNEYFQEEHLELFAPNGVSWYLRLDATPDLVTNALVDVAGRGIHALLPSGPDQGAWHRRLTEVQMLLKNHPVNQKREQQGKLTANALWFWGLGRLPKQLMTEFDCFVSKSFVIKGLAQIAGKTFVPNVQSWPSLRTLMKSQSWQRGAFVEDGLIAANRFANTALRNQVLSKVERDWAEPIVQALQDGQLKQCVIDDCQGHRYFITKRHLRYFWRKNQQAVSFQ